MAYNGKYVSIKHIIEKVYRDTGIEEIDFEAALEWSVELMGLIGIPCVYIDRNTNGVDDDFIYIENFKALLPPDLVTLKAARRVFISDTGEISGYKSMVESNDIYHNTQGTIDSIVEPMPPIVNVVSFTFDEDEQLGVTTTTISPEPIKSYQSGSLTYKIDNGYIFTNFETGYVELAYSGYPIDNEGFPLVPDDEKYKQALKYFLIYKLDWKNWRRNASIPSYKAIVNDSEQQSLFYISAARNKAHIPSVDKMESIKNMWVRSIPKLNEHSNNFRTTNIQEQRYNQRSIRRLR